MQTKISERGQALVLIALAIVGLIGITALAVDGGNAFLDRRTAQNAADSAAMASGLARIRGENYVQKAFDSAAQNGYNNNGVSNTVQVYSPPIEGNHVDDIEYIQIIITSNVKTYFAGVIGRNTITNRVSAVARTKTPEVKELMDGYAVVSLAPDSDCDNRKSFWVHGEATLDLDGGGVFVNSRNPNCALIEQGSGSIRIRTNHPISVVGGAQIQKPKLLTPYPPNTGVTPYPFPPPFFLPQIGCTKQAEIDEFTGSTMTAGKWDDDFPPPGVVNLGRGVYCIDDFIVGDNTTLYGTGVTFVVSGEVRWGNNATLGLSAPKSGENAGLLLYLPIDNSNKVKINGSVDSYFTGTILAPSAWIYLGGPNTQEGLHSQIIGFRIDIDGQSNIVVKYRDEQNFDSFDMPELELTE